MRRMLALMLVLALPLVLASCAEDEEEDRTDPAAAADKVDLALYNAFDVFQSAEDPTDILGMDFTGSYNLFEQAVTLDPNNMNAKAGAAVTNILRLPSDPMIADLIDELDLITFVKSTWMPLPSDKGPGTASGIGHLLLENLSGAAAPQDDLRILLTYLVTVLDHSIAYCNAIETHPDFEWIIEFEVESQIDTIEVDVTDIYMLESPLHWVKALLHGLLAYKMEVASMEEGDLVAALAQDSDFLTLMYPSMVTSAANDMTVGADEMHMMAQSLRSEEADQRHDVFTEYTVKQPTGWFPMPSTLVDQMDAMPTMLEDLMTNPMEITDDFDMDEGTPDATLWLNLGRLFDAPVVDWKAILPAYTIVPCGADTSSWGIVWEATTIDQWVWHPDSLHGLVQMPPDAHDITSEEMIGVFGLEEIFEESGCP